MAALLAVYLRVLCAEHEIRLDKRHLSIAGAGNYCSITVADFNGSFKIASNIFISMIGGCCRQHLARDQYVNRKYN